jgi:hypothetical protein
MWFNKNTELTQCNEELLNKLKKYLDIPNCDYVLLYESPPSTHYKVYFMYLMILHKMILYKQLYFYGLPMQKTDFIKNIFIFFFDSWILLRR